MSIAVLRYISKYYISRNTRAHVRKVGNWNLVIMEVN